MFYMAGKPKFSVSSSPRIFRVCTLAMSSKNRVWHSDGISWVNIISGECEYCLTGLLRVKTKVAMVCPSNNVLKLHLNVSGT